MSPSQTESTRRDRDAIDWLLRSDEPAISLMTRRDLLGEPIRDRELADWGRGGPNEMITLNALRALKAAGRLG